MKYREKLKGKTGMCGDETLISREVLLFKIKDSFRCKNTN
ncbi:hypothetical protein HDEF_1221 [Candidatus Hamiltonella defensa 5AT (Acyrthosiphon pisum)]|uniref:Uncharacterized protein n=1 Tax=Hamiltonella defensa subsp. Acyrthosiphon pisum (strain 5AT) TaxID=572265 RepID=C4K5N7_HAMD5|nr:hypothetical protein HDEF_1221 [Candidatus Hamiltonella defensa 5AT (Acyrthosiphon pisum)]